MAKTHRGAVGSVYIALIEGVIKVGFTTKPLQERMRTLSMHRGGAAVHLVTSAPGSFLQEQELVRLCAPYRSRTPLRHGREWFRPEVLPVLAQEWTRMFAGVAA